MDYSALIEKRTSRLDEVEKLISEPNFFNDQQVASETMREHRGLKKLLENWEKLQEAQRNLADNQELAKSDDAEMAEMAAEEIPGLETCIETLQMEVQYALLPKDAAEERDALIEIRAGAGGDEASLFAGELMKMYTRHSERQGWKTEPLRKSFSKFREMKSFAISNMNQECTECNVSQQRKHKVEFTPLR